MFNKKTVLVDSLQTKITSFKQSKSRIALCISSALLISTSALADNIWSENFNDPRVNNKGAVNNIIDLSNVNGWSIDISKASLTASSDWFKVTDALMEARDVDGVVEWISESIDITNQSNVKLSVLAAEQGSHEASDFFDLLYSVDGAPFVKVVNWQGLGSTEHTLIDDFTSTTIEADIAQGASLVIKVAMQNGAGSEYLRLDDVLVTSTGSSGNGDDGGGVIEQPEDNTLSDVCFNCPDLTKVADASAFNDNLYYEQVFDAVNGSQNKAVIKEKINSAISADHKQLTYSEVWTALTKTDEDPLNSDNVILFYRGLSLAKSSNGSGAQSSNSDNWNREHVWAKSHGFPSRSAYAYTDIHHLRPTDISVNSSRGNLDFDYSDSPLAESPQNRVDGDSFEPRDSVKGDVARIILYMDTRYAGNESITPDLEVVNRLTNTGEAKLGKLCVLLSWNENDPVDEFEQNRNNKIYEFQGNRNPFIDHPEWISLVYTQSCSGEAPTGPAPTNPTPAPTVPEPTDPTPTDPVPTTPAPGGIDLFFSEYVEGSSFNKAVEIYNPTLTTVDLTGYQFKLYSNGSLTPSSTFSLSGELLSNNVLVLGNSQVSGDLVSKIDVLSGALNFNGDDYIELVNGDTIIDSVGFYGVKQNWGSNKTLIRKESITQGDNNRTDAFVIDDQWNTLPSNTFSFLGAHNADVTPVDPDPIITPDIGACSDSATYINAIQGSGSASSMIDETKTIEGVVTSTVASLSGYFVQEESLDMDVDSTTSEGVFVFDENLTTMPAVGNKVRVQGVVKENFDRTQLSASTSYIDCGIGEAISSQEVSLPMNNAADWENYEGMLIHFNSALQVTDTFSLARFGQLSLSNGRLLKPTNVFTPNSAQAIALTNKNSRNIIVLDDMNNQQNPDVVPFPAPNLSYQNTVRLGDSVNGLTGVIDYSFRNYRVLPTSTPQFTSTNSRTSEPSFTNEGSLKVASFNVLNYFNGDGLDGGFPTARGADTAEEFVRQSDKIVSALVAINADVVGLMEIENDGYNNTSAISDLVNKLNTQMGENTYRFVNPNQASLGSDAIAVGLLYKPANVTLEGDAITTTELPFGNRQPLVQTFKEIATGESLTVAVNHFKSKGGCGSASGNNADANDGQGCWNELRTQAANQLTTWLSTMPTGTTDDDVLIIGDLNAYAKENPITTIESKGYKNLVEKSLGYGGYSYSFAGELGYLDHALASSSLNAQVVETSIWHINADEPIAFDYNTEFKSAVQLNANYGSDAYRASDHDPVVISLALSSGTLLSGDLDTDGDVDRNDLIAFTRLLRSGESIDMVNDFNKDGAVNARDIRSLMALCTRSRCAAE